MNKEPRRKNNAQSASSGRAADLLAKTNLGAGIIAGNVNPFEAVSTAFDDSSPREIPMDPEISVILKKMIKKDSVTREKALRELIDVSASKSVDIQARILQDFNFQFDKLALDGSAPVRAYSIRTLSYFIKALKRQSEAFFKQVIPFVILAQADSSASVVQQAELLLSENFPEQKRAKLLTIFAPSTAKLSIDFIRKEHPIFEAQKYDTEEEKTQRANRLIAQAMNTLAKLQSISPPIKEVGEMIANLLQDTQLLKAVVKESDQIKLGLLRLSTCPSSDVIELLIASPLAKWALENLDANDLVVSQACFSAFVDMASNPAFFSKFDVSKMVIPRFLNVIRKKNIHWRSCSPLYLPMTLLIYQTLPETERPTFLTRLLESFGDNLPFELNSLLTPWSRSFTECAKFAILKEGANKAIVDALINLTLKFALIVLDDEKSSQQIADFLRWITTKECFPIEKFDSFLSTFGNNLANSPTRSDSLTIALFSDPIPKRFTPLVSSFLRSPFKSKPALLSCLQNGDQDLLADLVQSVDIGPLIFGESELENKFLDGFSRLTLKLMTSSGAKFEMRIGSISEKIFEDCSPEDLLLLEGYFPKNDERNTFVEALIDQLTNNRNEKALRKLMTMLRFEEKEDQIREFLQRNANFNEKILFFTQICSRIELNEESGTILTKCLFDKMLEDRGAVSKAMISIFTDFFSKFPIAETELKRLWSSVIEEAVFQNVEETAHFYSQLCVSSLAFDSIFPSQRDVINFMSDVERYTFPEVLSELGFPTSSDMNSSKRTKEEWLRIKRLLRNQSHFALRTATQELSNRKWALCVSAVHLALYRIDGLISYTFDEDRTDERVATAFKEALKNDPHFADSILEALCSFPAGSPQIALLAARSLIEYTSKTWSLPSDLDSQQVFHLNCALRKHQSLSELKNEEDRWILRYHTSNPLDFLMTLSRAISSGNLDFELFIAGGSHERLTICTLRAALTVLNKNSLEHLDPSLIDFIICGLLTIFDSANGIIGQTPLSTVNPLVNAALSLASRIFVTYSKISSTAPESLRKEWSDLFYPTISQIILRIFVDLLDPENPVNCPILLPLCRAIWSFDTMVDETAMNFETKLYPSLDNYRYSESMQTMIGHCSALLHSDIHYAQFAGDHLLKLYAWKMYQNENEAFAGDGEEEKNDLKEETIVRKPPIILKEIIDSSLSLSSCLALDTCLRIIPLFSSHAERVAYFDSLTPLVLRTLPVIISLVSRENLKADSTLFLQPVQLESLTTVLHYACRLLFKLVESVPALVRMWFNNLDRSPSNAVNKFFRENLSFLAIEEELRKVRNDTDSLAGGENELKVRTLPSAGEVVAEYRVEETTMRLVIVLPPEWPLRVPQISLDKAVVASERAKKWLLQLTAFLFHQNGSIIEGLAQWKRQVDREVSGAEACTICMMSVHSTSHQLPRVRCRQCRNKFHSNCLYKWFESSNQSSCPLCRANFT